jgi:phosphoribosyl 1,2-cyclic phosphodiesterase
MSVSVSVLASGSRGNSTIVQSSSTRILVDAGISCRETFKRMKAAGDDPHSLSAIVITHEHTDHVSGLLVLARKLKIPVYMTGATHQAWSRSMRNQKGDLPELPKLETFSSSDGFQIGDIEVKSFRISHDAADPVGFTFRAEGVKVGFATDFGLVLENMKYSLRGCDILVIESNHDREKLKTGSYPWSVKQRIMERTGHLSNEKLAEFFATDYDGHASFIVLAHLSEENNHPEIALRAAEKALSSRQQTLWESRVLVAAQAEPMQPIRL